MRILFTVSLLALALCATGGASIIPFLTSGPTANGANFSYSYNLNLDNLEDLNPVNPSYVTLYDIPGLVGTPVFTSSVAGVTGTVTVQNTGVTPSTQLPTDNATVPNITVTFSESSLISGPQMLGTLSLVSSFGQVNTHENTSSAATKAGTTFVSQGTTSFEAPTTSSTVVPEPATFLSMGLGLLGLGMLLRKRA